MSRHNIVLPAMGEGVIEATVTRWLAAEGELIREDDPLVEVATDKVDTEIPSPVNGKIISIAASSGETIKVGALLAIIESQEEEDAERANKINLEAEQIRESINEIKKERSESGVSARGSENRTPSGKFLSPLVRSIASGEGISHLELDSITGTGMDGRITKDDLLNYINRKRVAGKGENDRISKEMLTDLNSEVRKNKSNDIEGSEGDEVIEMDRVRKLIADHMVLSKKTSPHVTSFIDADVTRMISWRNRIKESFLLTEGQKLTLTPIFIDAAARALNDFPMFNVSVDGYRIIRKRNINIGMAAALPDGNLIVPVIKYANKLSLGELAKAVNDLADRARTNKLKPDEITGGTFTITNFGTYDNLAGTPIINQPQAAILGIGAVRKMPAVIETPEGDVIAIRNIIILSLSYDHRVIDGALAGRFLGRVREILQEYPGKNSL